MRVLKSLGHKDFTMGTNGYQIMPKWDIFNALVLLKDHGHPRFFNFKIEILI